MVNVLEEVVEGVLRLDVVSPGTGVKGTREEVGVIRERPETPPKSRRFLIKGGEERRWSGLGGSEEEDREDAAVDAAAAAILDLNLTGLLMPDLFLILQTSAMIPLSSSMASAAEQPLLARSTLTALETARARAASLSERSGCWARIALSWLGLMAGGGGEGGETGDIVSWDIS